MSWFCVDDGFHSHPKVMAAGNEAVGLFSRCGSYAAQHLTDGFIPEPVALQYGNRRLVKKLVDTRLWVPEAGGWRMPDYLDFNPSREQVLAKRRAATDRQRRARSKGGGSRPRHAVTPSVTSHELTPEVTPPPSPSPLTAAAAAVELSDTVAIFRSKIHAVTALRSLRFDLTADQHAELERLIGVHGDDALVDEAVRTLRTPAPTKVTAFLRTWAELRAPGEPALKVVEERCGEHPWAIARHCGPCRSERLAGDA